MPDVDVMDESWIGVVPRVVGAALADAAQWPRWWPDLDLQVSEHRGPKGMRWAVRSSAAGPRGTRLAGSMEVWLEPFADGVVAHYFLRLDAAGATLQPGQAQWLAHHYRTQTKRAMWRLADRLDPARMARLHAPSGRG